ncbi:MAG: hypothetical protein JW900_11535 [Anaerolineae bacterium]|nr:hypothetical protein [Anaerolineae bacterium]
MAKADWMLGQVLFWLLVVAIAITGVVGIRRDGAVLAAHQAGLVGGRSSLGPEWGLVQAGSDLSAWWGIDPAQVGQAVEIVPDPDRRSVAVRVQGWARTLFGGQADLGAGSFQRREEFYPGPPGVFE